MKTALITGANKGIGYEVARQLAAKGFHAFVGARNEKAGRKAAEEIAKPSGKATFLEIDVADSNSVTTAAREFSNIADHLDVLVNNAGIIVDGDNAILEISDDLLRKTLETNTLGALRVTRAFAPLLRKSKAPRVINVSSGGGQLTGGADGWAPAYCISKTALNGVTVQLEAALPKFAVNSVCPGWVRTEMGGENASRSVEEGAETIVWLASEAPQDLTGKFLRDRNEIPW
ncbi:MAG TPA: SDR family NAD(P)-dependent oxidoreductase [Candidatus Acidoferrum sp.]|nr:SDR family NAD(P)-dependent oxidoreductase [Candidatus Acidoferrum sp.]